MYNDRKFILAKDDGKAASPWQCNCGDIDVCNHQNSNRKCMAMKIVLELEYLLKDPIIQYLFMLVICVMYSL